VDTALLESCVRDDLGDKAPRAMAVVKPLKVILTNWPEDKVDELEIENHPKHPEMGTHKVVMTREIYVEQEDFMEEPPKKYFRLFPGNEVRLMGAYIIKCEGCEKDENGNVTAVLCTVDMDSRNGSEGANRKVKGTLHWVSATENVPVEARMFEPILLEEGETNGLDAAALEELKARIPLKDDFLTRLNFGSLETCTGYAEKALDDVEPGTTYQFPRVGYFCKDSDSAAGKPVFNRVVGLKDTFAKQVKR